MEQREFVVQAAVVAIRFCEGNANFSSTAGAPEASKEESPLLDLTDFPGVSHKKRNKPSASKVQEGSEGYKRALSIVARGCEEGVSPTGRGCDEKVKKKI